MIMLDCPFCGHKGGFSEVTLLGAAHETLQRLYTIRCQGCGAEGPKVSDVNLVAAVWNMRKVEHGKTL